VEVTADQVRELRSKARVGAAGRAVALAFTALLAGFAFLRFDTWTKGYLTAGLGAAAVGLLLAGLFVVRHF
ncbi:MAG: hypothetical protein ACRC7O_16550, partial [Fimbriiglobus sp.]